MGKQRVIIVGDVHGCLRELEDLLEEVAFAPGKDRLIFVGDLVNKGPDSAGVLDLVAELRAEAVIGNHEVRLLKCAEDVAKAPPKWQALLAELGPKLPRYLQWIKSLPEFIEGEDFIVVHAGLRPDRKPEKTSRQILTTIRTWDGKGDDLNNAADPPWFELYKGDKLVVFGHWAVRGVVDTPKAVGLDSGCVYGKSLTCLILPERELFAVPAHEVYAKPPGANGSSESA